MAFLPASAEAIQHHLQGHNAECEIDEPTGVWMKCPDGMFAVVVCTGCFEVLFTGCHPDLDKQCEHCDAWMAHMEREIEYINEDEDLTIPDHIPEQDTP
jgi:hypothetical protein